MMKKSKLSLERTASSDDGRMMGFVCNLSMSSSIVNSESVNFQYYIVQLNSTVNLSVLVLKSPSKRVHRLSSSTMLPTMRTHG